MGTIVPRKTGQRIRSGIHIVSDVDSSYAISALAMQSDQPDDAVWGLDGDGTQPIQPARISNNADGSKSDDGFYNFTAKFSYMTFGMMSHFLGQVGLTSARSADVTVMWYNELDVAVFLTAKIERPLMPGPDAQYFIGGWSNVVFRFSLGVIIT